jgi:hypothetical protein
MKGREIETAAWWCDLPGTQARFDVLISQSKQQTQDLEQPAVRLQAKSDLINVSYLEGQLRVGGNLVAVPISAERLRTLRLDATSQCASIYFREIDRPVEVLTPVDGSILVPSISRAILLPLGAPRGVLAIIGLGQGLPLGPIFSIEAILGLLDGLRAAHGILRVKFGAEVFIPHCLGLLARMGAHTCVQTDTGACLDLCSLLGVRSNSSSALGARFRDKFIGQERRLRLCLAALEVRGYHLRLRDRVKFGCPPPPIQTASNDQKLERVFNFSKNATALAKALA